MIRLILIIFCSFIFSTNLSGYELAKMMDEKKQPQSSKSQITMKLIDLDKGREKTLLEKEMYSISKDDGNKMLMFFKTPKRDKGVGFLKIEALDTDKLSLFIPKLKKFEEYLQIINLTLLWVQIYLLKICYLET